jgi:solute carrier family 25, member 34/35
MLVWRMAFRCIYFSSTAAGIVVCVVMHPLGILTILSIRIWYLLTEYLDMVMSRMYNQKGNLYKSPLDCMFRTINTEDLPAIYKGFTAHLARLLPHTVSETFTGLTWYHMANY